MEQWVDQMSPCEECGKLTFMRVRKYRFRIRFLGISWPRGKWRVICDGCSPVSIFRPL